MEDNHAINEQPNSAVNYEEEYNKLVAEYGKLKNITDQLYGRVMKLENTWMLQRAGFLFEILKSDAFNSDVKIKAEEEIVNFLFPKQEEQTENKED